MTAELTDEIRQDWLERFRVTDGDCTERADAPEDNSERESWFDTLPQERYFASLIRHGYQLA